MGEPLHYGAIDPAQVRAAAAGAPPASASGKKRSSGFSAKEEVERAASATLVSNALTPSAREHQAAVEALSVQRAARTVAAPTLDADVKKRLRDFDEPICLFGEGPYERRERLRLILARRAHPKGAAAGAPGAIGGPLGSAGGPDVVVVDAQALQRLEETSQARLFYTEGSEELLAARKLIARHSLPRAIRRLRRDRKRYEAEDPFEAEARVAAHNTMLQKSIGVVASQVASDRPLCCGRLNATDELFATGSWSPVIQIWDMPSCEHRLTLRGHTERVHSVSWHPTFSSRPAKEAARRLHEAESEPDEAEADAGLLQDDSESDAGRDESFPGSCHLASGSSDMHVNIWDLNNPHKPAVSMEGHEDRINRVEIHPNGRFVLSSSNDETWRMWDIERGTELLLQEGHSTGVYALKVHPDGSLVLTGDMGGIVRVWDLRTGKSLFSLQGHVKQVLGISLNERMPGHVATCSDDNTVRLWDLRRKRSFETILAHDKLISEVKFEPRHGRFLLTAAYDNTLKLWSTVDWSCTRTLLGHESKVTSADISSGESVRLGLVAALSFSDGQQIASVSFDRTFKLWTPVTKSASSLKTLLAT